ncbi:MAG: glycosyltransferase [Verrucomicrobiaceae bacterium]|nr:glycosyltransferase [Verrucomicrobiaceae bacterium]
MNLLSRVSVIIPTRNCLSQVVDGLPMMREWLPHVGEVIIVDSESSDGTREFLHQQIQGPNVRYMDHPPGLYPSWNAGIQAASCEFVHLSTAGDTISASDLSALVEAAGDADVVCAAPHFVNQAGQPVAGPQWPIHELIERGVHRASGLSLLAIAMEFCQVPVRFKSWLGSSASNLYRRAIFESRQFPTDVGHSGDMMFGLRYAAELSAVFVAEKRGRFVLHESAGSRADLFDAFGAAYAAQYELGRAKLISHIKANGIEGLGESIWQALAFDAEVVRSAFAKERQITYEERAKKQALQSKGKPDSTKLALKHLEKRAEKANWLQRWALQKEIAELKRTSASSKSTSTPVSAQVEGEPLQNATCIVTAAEINERHGTGVLLQRIFRDSPDYIHVRSMNLYGGVTGGSLRIVSPDAAPDLKNSTVSRILAVPYSQRDVENALAIAESTKAPMIAWLMDHNLGNGEHQIPPALMGRLLDASQLRLGISPEFCALYEQLYGHRVHFVPPVVDSSLCQKSVLTPTITDGALLGNLWSQRWLEMLAEVLNVKVTSYGHNSPQWVKHDALARNVTMRGFLPENELISALRQHPYAIVPTGTLDERDDLPEIARYSLPSRTLYLSAVGNLPLIVVGHEESGVARFVRRHGLGLVVPYDETALNEAVAAISKPEAQAQFRQRAAELAPLWAEDDMKTWLWTSLKKGSPADPRWE